MEQKSSWMSNIKCGVVIEKSCFVFAIINAIAVSVGILTCIGLVISVLKIWLDPNELRAQGDLSTLWLYTGLLIIICIGTGIAFIFAVVLCHGVYKRKPRFVMAYLVFGILVETLSVLGTITFIVYVWDDRDQLTMGAICLGVCALYAIILMLVSRTYVEFTTNEAPARGHKKLVENYYTA